MTAPAPTIHPPDPDDFCRYCNGKGYDTEKVDYGKTITSDCLFCKGTGYRSGRAAEVCHESAR